MLPTWRKADASAAPQPGDPLFVGPMPPAGARAGRDDAKRESPVAHGWRQFRRKTDRYRLLTDVVGGILIVAILIGGLAAATGGIWPPVVVIESGSMMHAIQETPYGRFGTMDVGDMVFIRGIDGRQVETWAEGGEEHYGRPGTVIAYAPNGDRINTTVVHRAVAWVDVGRDARGQPVYSIHWVDGEIKTWGSQGIYFPPLGFDENFGFTIRAGYKPAYSGYITKGDNAFSNPISDQAAGISRLVEPAWIVGEVYGEVPWIGLAKLALTSGQTNPEVPGWERLGNAFAPLELWTMFFVTMAVVFLVPLAIDTWRAYRKQRREAEAERKAEEEAKARTEARKRAAEQAKAQPQRKSTTFAAIVAPPRPAPTAAKPPPKGGRPPS